MKAADSNTSDFIAKAEPGSDAYKYRVAEPVMDAVDAMPAAYRVLVHEHGYVDVYRAWKRGWSVAKIVKHAAGGVFEMPS